MHIRESDSVMDAGSTEGAGWQWEGILTRSARGGHSEAPGARVAYFDNLKFLLIFLVVFGHVLTIVSEHSRAANALINFIYLFHMPAFVFVSGMLAKRYYSRERGLC